MPTRQRAAYVLHAVSLLFRQEGIVLDLRGFATSVVVLVPFGVAAQNVDCTRGLEEEQVRVGDVLKSVGLVKS